MFESFINGMTEAGKLFLNNFENTESQVDAIVEHIEASFSKVPYIIPEVTYEELIDWFSEQPRHPDLERGAIFRRYCGNNKIAIIQVFLDASNNVIKKFEGKPYARKLVCSSIDEELAETFEQNNVIIVN